MTDLVDTLLEAVTLKHVARAGWVLRGIEAPESVAGHSWGIAWLVLALLPPELDRGRALTYAALHDLAEVRTGDVTPHDGIAPLEKHAAERAAMAAVCAPLPHLFLSWQAYEEQRDPEARFVKQLDRLDMAIQAIAYARQGHPGMDEFVDSADAFITDPALRDLLAHLRARVPR